MKDKKTLKKIVRYIALFIGIVICIGALSGTKKVYCDTLTWEQQKALALQYNGMPHDDDHTIGFINSHDSDLFDAARYHMEYPDRPIEPELWDITSEEAAQITGCNIQSAPASASTSTTSTSTTNASTDASKQTTSTQTTSKEEKKTEQAEKKQAKEETTTVDNTPVKNEVTKKPTCTEDGEKTYYNKNGDVVKTEKIAATGHDYEKTVTKEPTCAGKGIATYKCKNCGDTYTEDIPALGHQIDKGTVTKKAGMFTAGEKVYKCTRCGKVTRTEVIKSRYPITYLYIIIGVCAVIAAVVLAMVIHKKKHPLGI